MKNASCRRNILPTFVVVGMLLFSLCASGRGETIVFRNGQKLEVRDLLVEGETVSYRVKGVLASMHVKYVDMEATLRANEEKNQKETTPSSSSRQAPSPSLSSLPPMERTTASEASRKLQELFDRLPRGRSSGDDSETEDLSVSSHSGASFVVPFIQEHGLMFVQAKVNQKAGATFILDTGATVCTITPELAFRAGVAIDYGRFVTISTANGEAKAYVAMARQLELGKLVLENVPVIVTSTCKDNLLGQNILSRFVISFDYSSRTITFTLSDQSGKPKAEQDH